MSAIIEWIKSTSTIGSAGIWVMVAMLAIGWWKGLPGVLDAWSRRADQERIHREREIERLERQIAASDDRHSECMEGQKVLREEVDRLHKVIAGLVRQMQQMQLSAIRMGSTAPPETVTERLIAELDQIPGGADGKGN